MIAHLVKTNGPSSSILVLVYAMKVSNNVPKPSPGNKGGGFVKMSDENNP